MSILQPWEGGNTCRDQETGNEAYNSKLHPSGLKKHFTSFRTLYSNRWICRVLASIMARKKCWAFLA